MIEFPVRAFGIDSDAHVPAFAEPTEHVPEVDPAYRFQPPPGVPKRYRPDTTPRPAGSTAGPFPGW